MRNPRNATTHLMLPIMALGSLIYGGSLVLRPASATLRPLESDAALSMPGWNLGSNLNKGRLNHTATLLPNGKVLVAGGEDLGAGVAAASAELYDSTGNWIETGNLKTGRYLHTATLLTDGKVVIAGGCGSSQPCVPLNSAELYDSTTGTWTSIGNLNTARWAHTATLLSNGKVLVVGGYGVDGPLKNAELFDPATGTWRSAGNLNNARVGHTATLLANGKVLVTGGVDSYKTSELYDPATQTWSDTGGLNVQRDWPTATLLANGKVLVAGGGVAFVAPLPPYLETHSELPSSPAMIFRSYSPTNTAELYDPATGAWTLTGNLFEARYLHTATLLPNGRVLVADGLYCVPFEYDECDVKKSAEVYEPATGAWSFTDTPKLARVGHTSTRLANGKILTSGGLNYSLDHFLAVTSELFDPGSNQIQQPEFFVYQHYLDFLGRGPDPDGFSFWTNEIKKCGNDQTCIDAARIRVTAAFYLSIEFQQTGYLVERIFKAAFGDATNSSVLGGSHQISAPIVRQREFDSWMRLIRDGVVVGQTGWEQVLERNKTNFAVSFAGIQRFNDAYPETMTPAEFVDKLFLNEGVTPSPSERSAAINEFGAATHINVGNYQIGQVLLHVAENPTFVKQEFNRAFVLMQYFGYLRRDPNAGPDVDFTGYEYWLNKLNQFNGDFVQAEMVKAFIDSKEYQRRFAP